MVVLAAVDSFFTARLKAQLHEVAPMVTLAYQSDATEPRDAQMFTSSETELLDAALNSRLMQWGAVSVMMLLTVWVIMKFIPNQLKLWREEIRGVVTSFTEAIDRRDELFVNELRDIRESAEQHVSKFQDSKDRQTEAFHELTAAVRASGSVSKRG